MIAARGWVRRPSDRWSPADGKLSPNRGRFGSLGKEPYECAERCILKMPAHGWK